MRSFLTLASVVSSFVTAMALSGADLAVRSTSNQLPRKVIVGTVVQWLWVPYPGLQKRLQELTTIVDRMAEQSRQRYGRDLDLAVLPEAAVTGEIHGNIRAHSYPLRGDVEEAFARCARQHRCYIVVPMYLREGPEHTVVSNAAVLIGRNGDVVGIYRKVHLAVPAGSNSLEDGTTPGKQVPVFQCDFGKLGIQICFDMEEEYGWRELARHGAEVVAWPTQSPQTAHPAFRAMQNRYYIVSSTWKDNASIFEPTGKITSQVKPPGDILIQQLDLSYALLLWSAKLEKGLALQRQYGERVGFRYYEEEDRGIFWSNDPAVTIERMIRSIGVTDISDELKRIRRLYRAAGVPGS